MVKRNQTILPHDIDRVPRKQKDLPSGLEQNRKTKPIDDVIQALAGDYENERARQVVEWEKAQTTTRLHRS